jgi:uncharacterized integral membrane protein (TIGR00697 family)
MNILERKENRLFLILGGFFIANALIAEFIGIKIFSLENTLGLNTFYYKIFGEKVSFDLTAGVMLWPIVFVLTDIINEYFGIRGVRFLSYLTVALISYAFIGVYFAINLSPTSWWIESVASSGIPNFQKAFEKIFGQGLWIIAGSLTAFLIGQIVDVRVFQKLKSITGENKIWLRASGSTLISQLIDSFVVLFIAFKIGADWSWSLFLAVGISNYIFKFIIAIVMTPFIYLSHTIIDNFLGNNLALKMKKEASNMG